MNCPPIGERYPRRFVKKAQLRSPIRGAEKHPLVVDPYTWIQSEADSLKKAAIAKHHGGPRPLRQYEHRRFDLQVLALVGLQSDIQPMETPVKNAKSSRHGDSLVAYTMEIVAQTRGNLTAYDRPVRSGIQQCPFGGPLASEPAARRHDHLRHGSVALNIILRAPARPCNALF